MAEIIIKRRKEPIVVDFVKGSQIKKFIDDKNIPENERVSIETPEVQWSGMKEDIRQVFLDKSMAKRVKIEKPPVDPEVERREERKKIRAIPPEERSKRTGYFGFLFYSVMRRMATPEELQCAIKLQEKFYQSNPRRTVPDESIFVEVFPREVRNKLRNVVPQYVIDDQRAAQNEND